MLTEDYATARQKSIKAQDTSELSSENDGKRRRRQRILSSDSENSDEFTLKMPPKLPCKLKLPPKVLRKTETGINCSNLPIFHLYSHVIF